MQWILEYFKGNYSNPYPKSMPDILYLKQDILLLKYTESVITQTSFTSLHWQTEATTNNTSFFLFLSPTSCYLSRLGVVGYYSLDHTQWHTTVGRTPLNEGSARRRDLYLTNTNIHAPAGFEPAIPADERLQTHALDRSATGNQQYSKINIILSLQEIQLNNSARLHFRYIVGRAQSLTLHNSHQGGRILTIHTNQLYDYLWLLS